jgi:glutamate synthase domain-containing protein 3
MTGGRVIVLGRTGRNFAAGMSGGIAYVFDVAGDFRQRCNHELVDLEPLEGPDDINLVRSLVERHVEYTGSDHAARILSRWGRSAGMFVKVMPRDYKRALEAEARTAAAQRTLEFVEVNGIAVNG